MNVLISNIKSSLMQLLKCRMWYLFGVLLRHPEESWKKWLHSGEVILRDPEATQKPLLHSGRISKTQFKIQKYLKILNFGLSFWILIFGFWIYSFSEDTFVYDAKKRRDPFIPLVTADGRIIKLESESDKEEVRLEGIIYESQGLSYAVLNGTVAKIGDVIEGYKVVKIEPSKVILSKSGKNIEIELKKEE